MIAFPPTAAGTWESLSVEVRPSLATGTLKPFYLTRKFRLEEDNRFELIVTNYADPDGKIPLFRIDLRGHVEWPGTHPVAPSARQADFSADLAYDVTPLAPGFADVLNQTTQGFDPWEIHVAQSVFRKAFPPFGLAEGQVFREYDLVYVDGDYQFWGARHVDGRGFDRPENRPACLQIPMKRIT